MWGDASPSESITGGGAQWQKWGKICTLSITASITMESSWGELKIFMDLPVSHFPSTSTGIIQSQDSGLAYNVKIDHQGVAYVRPDVNPHSGWYRGLIVYICD